MPTASVYRQVLGKLIAWPNRLHAWRAVKRGLWRGTSSVAGRLMVELEKEAAHGPSGQPGTAYTRAGDGPHPFGVVASFLGWRVGRVSVRAMWQDIGLGGWWLCGTWVHPAFRGMGLGERLVLCAEREAVRAGMSVLYLNVEPDNVPAMALYHKLGYGMPEQASYRLAIEAYNRRVGNRILELVLCKRLA